MYWEFGFKIAWLLFLFICTSICGNSSKSNTLFGKLDILKQEAASYWKNYENLKDDYNKLIIMGITDPTKLLKTLNLTITFPTSSTKEEKESKESGETKISKKRGEEDDDSEERSYEIITPPKRNYRQGPPAAPAANPLTPIQPVLGILPGVILLPILTANLVMTIIIFGINTSLRVDSPRLTELRQQQVNALAALAGVPQALVTVADTDDAAAAADTAAAARDDAVEEKDSAEKLKFEILKKSASACDSSAEDRSLGTDPVDVMYEIVETIVSAPLAEQVKIIFGVGVFLFAGASSIEYFGLDTTLILGLALVALILLLPASGGSLLDTFRPNQKHRLKRIGLLCLDDSVELRSLVHNSINKVF